MLRGLEAAPEGVIAMGLRWLGLDHRRQRCLRHNLLCWKR